MPKDLVHGFDNFRFFNHTQTVSLPFLCLLTLHVRSHRILYWSCFCIVSAWWSIIYLTSARGTFLGIFLGLTITALVRGKVAKEWCRTLFLTALAGALVYLALFHFLPTMLGYQPVDFSNSTVRRTLSDPTSQRMPLWELAWGLILEYPILGAGPAHFAHFTSSAHNAAHPHNWILQIASEWGLPALLTVLLVVALGFRRLLICEHQISATNESGQTLLCAWLTIGVALATDALVSGTVVMPVSQLWIALYAGCAYGWVRARYVTPRSDIATTIDQFPLKLRCGLALAVLAALVFLWAGVLPELLDFRSYHERASSAFPGMYHPRIWLTGHF